MIAIVAVLLMSGSALMSGSTIVAHVNFGEGRLERHMAHKFARVKRFKKLACVKVVISSSESQYNLTVAMLARL